MQQLLGVWDRPHAVNCVAFGASAESMVHKLAFINVVSQVSTLASSYSFCFNVAEHA
jgi:hypothetical protein